MQLNKSLLKRASCKESDDFHIRSVEDLKERYYEITGKLQQIRSSNPAAEEIYVFDAEHERKRKEQLRRLCDRTPEEIEEEQVNKR